MPKPPIFERIMQDLEAGDFGKARDRLNTLVRSRPNDLEVREMLGTVYAKLGDPVEAGRYWYLVETKNHEQLEACKAFEDSRGGNPSKIAHALHYSGDIEAVPCPRAKEMLRRAGHKAARARLRSRAASVGCVIGAVIGLVIALFIIGAIIYGMRSE